MRRLILDGALALLALALLVPVGLFLGWHLSRRGPGEPVEVDLAKLSRHAGAADGHLGVGRIGTRTVSRERLLWYSLTLPHGEEAALLSPTGFAFYEEVRFEGDRMIYDDGQRSLVVEVRP